MIGAMVEKQSSRQRKFLLSFSFVFICFLLTFACPGRLYADIEQGGLHEFSSSDNTAMQLAQQQTQSPTTPSIPPLSAAPQSASKPLTTPTKPDIQSPAQFPTLPESDRQPASIQPGQDTQSKEKSPSQTTMTGAVKKGQVSLNFDDADIYSVIQTVFANILRYNYIIDPRVKGRVTFRSTTPVPEENVLPLMEIILRLNGIAMVEEGGLFRIVPMGDAPREPAPVGYGRDPQSVQLSGKALLQVIPMRYLQSTEMVKLITPFVSTNAVIVDAPKSNHIIIVDTDSNVKRLLKLINLFDNEQQKEKRPQVFVYNVQNGKAKDMATLLQQIFLGARPPVSGGPTSPVTPPSQQPRPTIPAATPTGVTAPHMTGEALVSDATKIYSDDILNAVIIVATAEDFTTIKQTVDKIDVVPRQVLIEAVIAQVDLIDNMSLGIAWSLKTNLGGLLSSTIGFNLPITAPTSGGFTFTGIDPGGDLRALISALATKSKAKLLATPHILVSDNREARIQVGRQVPIITSETYGSLNVSQQRNIQYKDIGIILKVKPRINEGGLVSIELNQEISDYDKIKLYANEDQIIINKTDVSTNLVVQDNQTIIIGGLIREKISASNTGIPWLNKIPILGYLFGNTADDTTQTEIVILLTPRVMKSIQDVSDVTSEYTNRFSNVGIEKGKGKEPVEKNKGAKVLEDKTVDKSDKK
jgi:type II secretory pathway component GspD/PulD (secretin)